MSEDFNSPNLFEVNAKLEYPKADQLLEEAMTTYRERNKVYGSSYHKHGEVMAALYPKGLTLVTPHDFNLMGVLNMVVSKLCRLSQTPGHRDSIHDIGVYSFMYEELLAKRESQLAALTTMADTLIPFSCSEGMNLPPVMSIEELKVHMAAGTVKAGAARPLMSQSNWEKLSAEERNAIRLADNHFNDTEGEE